MREIFDALNTLMSQIMRAMVMKAKLRVCASCEWIFKDGEDEDSDGCPKCGFAHYSARYVYGDKCYAYAKTQKPWLDKKLVEYELKLRQEVLDRQTETSKRILLRLANDGAQNTKGEK